MATEVGTAYVRVLPSAAGFSAAFAKQANTGVAAAGTKAGKGFGGGLLAGAARFAGPLAVALGVGAAVNFGSQALSQAADFEQSMNILQSASGASNRQLRSLSAFALKMGADTVFSANEAAGAMIELAKAGISPAQIRAGALQSTLALAATEGLNLADAAIIMSNAMNTFGVAAKDSQVVADALAGASNASSASVYDLSLALSQVGPGARKAGLDVADVAASLAAFADAGIRGSDAGTSLKTFLARLVPATSKAKAAFADLGLEVTNADGSFKSIQEIAGQLKRGLAGLTPEEATRALQAAFGSDAARAALVFGQVGQRGLGRYTDAATEVGSASKLADARMKGLRGSLEQLRGSFETLQITLGQAAVPLATNVVKGLTTFVNFLSNELPNAFASAKPVFDGLGQAFSQFWTAAQPILVRLRPLLVGIFTGIAERWRGIIQVLSGVFTTLAGILSGDSTKIKQGLLTIWTGIKTAIVGTFRGLVTGVVLVFRGLGPKIGAAVTGLGPRLGAWWVQAWRAALTAVKLGAQAILRFVASLPGRLLSFLINLPGRLYTFFVMSFQRIVAAARVVVPALLAFLRTLPGRIVATLGDIRSRMIEVGGNIVRGLIDGIRSFTQWAIDQAKEFANNVVAGIKNALGIASPSKVFALLGEQSAAGFAQGLDQPKQVSRVVSRLTNAAAPRTAVRTGRASGGTATSRNTNVVYQFGDIRGVDMNDAMRYADRRRRLAALGASA